MLSYPFHKIAVFGIGLGICVGCETAPQQDANLETPTPSSQTEATANENGSVETSLSHHIELDAPIFIDAEIEPLEAQDGPKGFELSIDLAELANPIADGIAVPCQVEYLQIDSLGGAHPVDLQWFDGEDATFEILIDILEPEFKQTVGHIFQTSSGMVEVDISDKVQTGQDYVLDIELLNVDHGERCLADGLVRFDPVDEL